MDILLHHGDHERNAQGFLQRADGARESIQQAMIRLSVAGEFLANVDGILHSGHIALDQGNVFTGSRRWGWCSTR